MKKNSIYQFLFIAFCSIALSTFHSGSTLARSTLLNIPDDYATIQSAINAASDGDTVYVAPGRYLENINFNGKAVTVASYFVTTADTSYISKTIIDGNKSGHVVEFSSGEDSTSVLKGITITNGSTFDASGRQINEEEFHNGGGGIFCLNSSPTLDNLIITDNKIYAEIYGLCIGGGIYCNNASPIIKNTLIQSNYVLDKGAGLYCIDHSSPILKNVNFRNHTHGSIYCNNNSNLLFDGGSVEDCRGSGIVCSFSNPVIKNVTFENISPTINGWISNAILCNN